MEKILGFSLFYRLFSTLEFGCDCSWVHRTYEKFFDSNSGLKSRFNTFIEYEDYSVDELEDILVGMCANNDYELSEDAKVCAYSYLNNKIEAKEDNFANGRMVRNLYEDLIMNHTKRVFNINALSKVDLKTILDVDFKFDSDVKTD